MVFPKPISGKIERRGNEISPLFSVVLLVPVERIELPTFGLQNRCSTAELNRRTRFNNPFGA
jgi:hypothetical protein